MLSTCDRTAAAAERQIEIHRMQKQALMRQLLSGRRRVPAVALGE